MIVLDTNILVYALREECSQHKIAKKIVEEYAEGSEPWTLPWPCVYEFFRVLTHPQIFSPPTSHKIILENLEHLMESPSFVMLSETQRHFQIFAQILKTTPVTGNLIFDVHIVALMKEHGIQDIITNDNDFQRFEKIFVKNPFS